MSLSSQIRRWWQHLTEHARRATQSSRRSRPRHGHRCRPWAEHLEDRLTPTGLITLPTTGFSGSLNCPVINYEVDISQLNDGTHSGLASATLVVTYPTGVFNLPVGGSQATADVSLGSIPLSDGGNAIWSLSANAPTDGVLLIALSSKPNLGVASTMGGSMVLINFPVLLNPPAPVPLAVEVVSAVGNAKTTVIGILGAYWTTSLGLPATGSITIDPASSLAITTANVFSWTVYHPGYLQSITATGGSTPYTFSSTGTLPTGLMLSTAGVISGTPTAIGVYKFAVYATDAAGDMACQAYSVVVNPALAITTIQLPGGEVNVTYSQTISALGGTGSSTFTTSTGTLPPGLTLSTGGVLSGMPTAAGTFTFTVTATDQAGSSASYTYTVLIYPNPVPNGDVNAPYQYTFIVVGIGGQTGWHFISSGTLPPGLTLATLGLLAGIPTTPGVFTFTVTAIDSVGDMYPKAVTIVINPALVIATTTLANGIAGAAYSQTIGTTGGTTPITFSVPASSLPPGLTLSSAGILTGTPTGAGTFVFTVTASDAAGASVSRSYTLNIAPASFSKYVIHIVGQSTVQAGTGLLFTVQASDAYGDPLTSYSGPATINASLSPTSAGTFPGTVSINASGQGFFLANLQQAGSYTISVADTSQTFTGSTSLTVTPGPATRLAFAAQPQNTPTGDALPGFAVQVQDPYGNVITSDNSDSVTLGVASGPGGFAAGSITTAAVHNGVATFANLMLVVPGNYTLSAIVPTKYTGPNSASFKVLPLQVTSLTPSLTGFTIQFNAPFLVNATTPILYGVGSGATGPVPSVTLLGPHGLVEGSLVPDATAHTLTFVETNTASLVNNQTPLLPFGGYTVDIHGSAAGDGIQALNSGGGFLDGKGTGVAGSGDYLTGFVWDPAPGLDALWVPPTADGPGQALEAPGQNQAGGGYPLYLDDSTGLVTDVQATLSYNPALLTVTPSSTATFTVTVPSAGTADLHYSGPALAKGVQTPVGFLTAAVPAGTAASPVPYKAEDLLHLSNVSLNHGSIGFATSDAVHLVAYVGDADGSGSYSSSDSLLITRVVLQTDTGFAAYPLVDPTIVADTDGSGFIPSDAALQVNEAGVGVPTANLPVPPIPSGVHFAAVAEHARLSPRIVIEVFGSSESTTKSTKDTKQEATVDSALVDPWLDVNGITKRKTILTSLARR
jgi:Putative Ig domain